MCWKNKESPEKNNINENKLFSKNKKKKKREEALKHRQQEEQRRKEQLDKQRQLFNSVDINSLKFNPKFEVQEFQDSFSVSAYIPGMDKNEIHMKLSDNEDKLSVEGVRYPPQELLQKILNEVKDEEDLYRYLHGKYGKFIETFQLPSSINKDAINASYQNGILRITIPKKKMQKKSRNSFFDDGDMWW